MSDRSPRRTYIAHLSQCVADSLGNGWSSTPAAPGAAPGAQLTHPDGWTLELTAGEGNLTIRGTALPHGERWHGPAGREPCIELPDHRYPHVIAREISRRLIPNGARFLPAVNAAGRFHTMRQITACLPMDDPQPVRNAEWGDRRVVLPAQRH
ncbi:hypothetical protein [Streptomyces sp. 8N706]|uniref:hypothetical protein n=1 Tax=Streptomyces sp. 8N706 TaxID=3457416 RepID=UPI003FD176E1